MAWKAERAKVDERFDPKDPERFQQMLRMLQMYILARAVMVFYELVGYSMDCEDAAHAFSEVSISLRDGKIRGEFRLRILAPPPPEVASYDLETGVFNDHQLVQNCPERFVATIGVAYVASRCYPERVVEFKMNGRIFEARNGEIQLKKD